MDSFRFESGETIASRISVPLTAIFIYLVALVGLDRTVKKPLRVLEFEVVHNAFLVIVSFVVMCGTAWGAWERVSQDGLVDGLLCSQREGARMWDGKLGLFTYIFYLSKFYELLDTIVLALRKKNLIFLHVFHHAAMPLLCWSWFAYPWLEGSAWCSFINSFIHFWMYQYYLISSINPGRRVWWKKYLTSAQIIQFISGLLYVAAFLFLKAVGRGCQGHLGTALASTAVNLSFLALFVIFYKRTYRVKKS